MDTLSLHSFWLDDPWYIKLLTHHIYTHTPHTHVPVFLIPIPSVVTKPVEHGCLPQSKPPSNNKI